MIYVENDEKDPYFNHALEEYLLDNEKEDVLMLWRNTRSVLIGRNQDIYSEVNMDYIEKNGIKLVRRLSGGGSIYCDEKNMQYTIITDAEKDSIGKFAKPLCEYLKSIGIKTEFSGRNDIILDGRKISGNAQFKRNGRMIHHGSILFDMEDTDIKKILKPDKLKYKAKGVRSVESRICFLKDFFSHDIEYFMKDLKKYLMDYFKIERTVSIKDEDIAEIMKIREKFMSYEWNFKKKINKIEGGRENKMQNLKAKKKHECGIVEYSLLIDDDKVIRDVKIGGDFFFEKDIRELEEAIKGVRYDKKEVENKLKNIEIGPFINSLQRDDFIADLFELEETKEYKKKPEWLKIKIQGGNNFKDVEHLLKDLRLNTVCKEANCPNRMECYERRTATFMILGANCTRNCKYCNVSFKKPEAVDEKEAENVAKAVNILKLKHAVITSVTRDDLQDEGAMHFKKVCEEIKNMNPETTVELLIPDMHAKHELLDIVFSSKPDVLNHNIEAVRRIFEEVRPKGNYDDSMEVLRYAHEKGLVTKSGFMVGLGESFDEVMELLRELREVNCEIVTVGQYLRPSKEHYEVKEYIHPDTFKKYEKAAYDMGFKRVTAGPFVRSSYHAEVL